MVVEGGGGGGGGGGGECAGVRKTACLYKKTRDAPAAVFGKRCLGKGV